MKKLETVENKFDLANFISDNLNWIYGYISNDYISTKYNISSFYKNNETLIAEYIREKLSEEGTETKIVERKPTIADIQEFVQDYIRFYDCPTNGWYEEILKTWPGFANLPSRNPIRYIHTLFQEMENDQSN